MKNFLLVILLSPFIASCYTTEEIASHSNARLCSDFLSTNSMNVNYTKREIEIRKRGVDCSQYAELAQLKIMKRQQNARNSQALIDLGNSLLNTPTYGTTTPTYGGKAFGTAFLKDSYTQGFNKVCIYDKLGSVYTITIGSTELCPLTQ